MWELQLRLALFKKTPLIQHVTRLLGSQGMGIISFFGYYQSTAGQIRLRVNGVSGKWLSRKRRFGRMAFQTNGASGKGRFRHMAFGQMEFGHLSGPPRDILL